MGSCGDYHALSVPRKAYCGVERHGVEWTGGCWSWEMMLLKIDDSLLIRMVHAKYNRAEMLNFDRADIGVGTD